MLKDKLPKEITTRKKACSDLQRVVAEPAMGQSDLDEINKKVCYIHIALTLTNKYQLILVYFLSSHRVATAQGKQGIWLLTFPDRENAGNLVNLIFYTGKIVPTHGKF